MRKFGLSLVLAAALGAGAMLAAPAQAAPAGGLGQLGSAADDLNLIEKTQYVYGGYRHCWYGGGWHGPGWYRCGYAWRRGLGWGGPVGWNGWVYGRGPVVVVPRGRYYWGGRYYNNRYWHGGRWRYR
jgi:hypothetical protein